MVEKKIKDTFNHTRLTSNDKERIYQNIMREAQIQEQGEQVYITTRIERRSRMRKLAVAGLALVLVGSASVGAVHTIVKKDMASKSTYQIEAEKANDEKEKKQQTTKEEKDEIGVEDPVIITMAGNEPTIVESSVVDEANKLTLNVLDGTSFYGAGADGETAESNYSIYPQVIGKGIESITYTVKNGAFYKKIEKKESEISYKEKAVFKEYIGETKLGDREKEFWALKKAGSSYTVKYEEQNTIDHLYALNVSAKLREKTDEQNGREVTYRSLAEELLKNKIDVTIRYKDGHTVNKILVFEKSKEADRPQKVTMHWK